jgi:hypothetical protein
MSANDSGTQIGSDRPARASRDDQQTPYTASCDSCALEVDELDLDQALSDARQHERENPGHVVEGDGR